MSCRYWCAISRSGFRLAGFRISIGLRGSLNGELGEMGTDLFFELGGMGTDLFIDP